jgi:hypothetical protein
MRALSTAELLHIWEWGLTQPPAERALMLLAAASPDVPQPMLASLSIGQRDAQLLTLREWTFGPQLASLATCPGCGELLEQTLSVEDIRLPRDVEPSEVLSVKVESYEVRFRLPNSLDLAAIADHKDLGASRHRLLERCLLAAHRNEEELSADQLPANVVDALVDRMAEADPQADVQLALSCPACGHQWQAVFDIVSFFWSEINAWAYRILREVHTLASAYGWREADILALNPWRRQMYLEMVSG